MHKPLEIRFRNMERLEPLVELIEKKVAHLEHMDDRMVGCKVVIESPNSHHHRQARFHVRIELSLPGKDLVVSHDAGRDEEHEDAAIAVQAAFAAIERRLEDLVRRRHHAEKLHLEGPHGLIVRILPADECGFIETSDGREVYFHRNSLRTGDFDTLAVGMPVRFAEESGEYGPQASTVHLT